MLKDFACALCLYVVGLIPLAAQPNLDSLWRVWNDDSQADTARLKAMNDIAWVGYVDSQPDSAYEYAQQQYDFAQRRGLKKYMALALNTQGVSWANRDDDAKALDYYQRVLKIYEEIGDKGMMASPLNNIAVLYSRQGDQTQALAYYQRSLEIAEEVGNKEGMPPPLFNMGGIHIDQGDYPQAMDYFQRGLKLSEETGNERGMAFGLSGMGWLSSQQGDYPQALDYFQRSLTIAEKMGDSLLSANTLISMGGTYYVLGKNPQAMDCYQRSLPIHEKIGNRRGIARVLIQIGDIYNYQGDYPRSLDHLQRGLTIAEEIGAQGLIALAFANIGGLYRDIGDYPQALDYYLRRLESAEKSGSNIMVADAQRAIASIYNALGDYPQALDYAQQGLKVQEAAGNKRGIAKALGTIGEIYHNQGDYRLALEHFQRALKIDREIGRERAIGKVLTNIGIVYNQINDPANAIIYCQEGLQATEAARDSARQQLACECLYQAYEAVGNYRQAFAYHQQWKVLSDSLFNEENTKKLTRLEMQYTFDKQEAEIRAEQAETELAYQAQLAQRNYLVLGSLGLLGIGLIGFFFFRYRQQQQARRRELALQQERERQAQLAELDQLKTTFFTNVSHEFRTPLTVMLGMAEQLPANIDQARSLIHRNGQRLLRLINQLLDLARLESQDLSLNLVQGDIMAYLRYVAESFYTLAQQREIDLQVSAEPEILVMDYDPEKLQDILYNLLSNALKYTPSGGEVRLAMRQAEERLQVEVADTGPGIPEKELPLVFNRFYQGSATAQEGSSGIGLALVQALLERMGGEITVASTAGEGATFTAWLPIQRAAETTLAVPVAIETSEAVAAPSSEVVLPEDPDQPQVLLIEDNPDVIAYLSAILGSQYNLLTATDGNSGLALAQERIPDLVVCDVMMPGKDGFAVTEALKTDTRTSHIPVILLTAKATQADKLEGLSHGADAYLTKPFDRAELMLRIDKLLALRAELQARYRAIPAVAPIEVEDSKPPKPPTLDELFLEKIRETINQQLSNPKLSVHDLADVVHLSHSQVYRKVKALTGLTPTLFIRAARLHRAKELLETTSLTVSEVAYEAGFNDPNYFSRTFAKEFGQRPSALREG